MVKAKKNQKQIMKMSSPQRQTKIKKHLKQLKDKGVPPKDTHVEFV